MPPMRILHAAAVTLALVAESSLAVPFVVTTADDAGPGSLRQALLDANAAAGADEILFDIPGDGPHTIALLSQLPTSTGTLLIDGYSQPGASPNTLAQGWDAEIRIEIDALALASARGLQLIEGPGSELRGLAIFNVRGVSIQVEADDAVVAGNVVGMRADARTPNQIGATHLVGGQGAIAAHRSRVEGGRRIRIGGPAPADRNLVAGTTNGISAQSSFFPTPRIEDLVIENNWLGLDGSGLGVVAIAQQGIPVNSAQGTIVRDNVIVMPGGGVNQVGPFVGGGLAIPVEHSLDTVIEGNRIGVDPVGDGLSVGLVPFGGGSGGIRLRLAITQGGRLGDPLDPARGNLIGYTHTPGITLEEGAGRIALAGNRIISSGLQGANDLAIDLLLPSGPNINDLLDVDSGSNDLQNHPELDTAVADATTTAVSGTLGSEPDTLFRVEFFAATFCPANGRGPAQSVLGSIEVTTDAQGDAAIDAVLPLVNAGQFVSAIATDPDGNSSEHGTCVVVTGGPSPGALRFSNIRYVTTEFGALVSAVVQRVGGSDGAVSVQVLSEDGTAQAGADYLPIDTVLNWADGDASERLVPLTLLDDFEAEPTEHFVLRLLDPGGGAALGRISGTVVNVHNDLPVAILDDGFEG